MIDRTFFIDRAELFSVFRNPRVVQQFETLQESVATSAEASTAAVEATQTQRDAAYVTLSANAELPNERVLAVGPGLALDVSVAGKVKLLSNVYSDNGWSVSLNAVGATNVQLPVAGILATTGGAETFSNKTLSAPKVTGLGSYADNATALGAGQPVGALYIRTGHGLDVVT